MKDLRNELLKRREMVVMMEFDSNPGFEKSKEELAKSVKTSAENIAIKSVRNNFGTREFVIEAFVYDSASDKERVEPKPKAKKAPAGG